jgi:hypothetical protein
MRKLDPRVAAEVIRSLDNVLTTATLARDAAAGRPPGPGDYDVFDVWRDLDAIEARLARLREFLDLPGNHGPEAYVTMAPARVLGDTHTWTVPGGTVLYPFPEDQGASEHLQASLKQGGGPYFRVLRSEVRPYREPAGAGHD